MQKLRTLVAIGVVASGLVLGVGDAYATDISGTISSTLVIFEDSQLVGNVTCTVPAPAPCIQFGAPGIELKLNGFTMTGLANPVTGCGGAAVAGDGIDTNGHNDVEIQGPGLVQRFRENGIGVRNSTGVKVEQVTASTNCVSGIFLINSHDNDIKENVSVRNGFIPAACGGIELVNSNNNRIVRNETSGNGYVNPPGAPDFGIGLLATSNGNLVKENSAVGNTNGIFLTPATSGNVVRGNIVAGNPPIQVSNSFLTFTGVDIRNLSPAGANTFEDNLCATSLNAPCPNFPNFAGHQNP